MRPVGRRNQRVWLPGPPPDAAQAPPPDRVPPRIQTVASRRRYGKRTHGFLRFFGIPRDTPLEKRIAFIQRILPRRPIRGRIWWGKRIIEDPVVIPTDRPPLFRSVVSRARLPQYRLARIRFGKPALTIPRFLPKFRQSISPRIRQRLRKFWSWRTDRRRELVLVLPAFEWEIGGFHIYATGISGEIGIDSTVRGELRIYATGISDDFDIAPTAEGEPEILATATSDAIELR